ncbi:hypothetical protein JX265_006214 [Neoarthrinium moseri]|uniref:RNA ligase domain-containing protein n=1 Tax=Neoarthrinium moseri TaxID=1658444 RepID=A0A9P9WMA0_9PEZI|nr:hypothetical protein JX265_006214 [Neoarthrinium moseri]
MGRKLVTVRRIGAIKPIEGADRIEIAVIDGWTCIVKKGQFVVDGLAVFFEIDSFLPGTDARWAFLEKNFIDWNGQRGFRIKSMKMRGHMSQGLLEPLEDFPEIIGVIKDLEAAHGRSEAEKIVRGLSFEEPLGVQKWEKMYNTWDGGEKKENVPLPAFIQRTDQERCQNLPDLFDEWKDEVFQETTKMDGSSMTAYFLRSDSDKTTSLPEVDSSVPQTALLHNGRFGVCSRQVDLGEQDKNGRYFWEVAKQLDLANKLSRLDRNIAIQGELCGSSIQSNFEGFPVGIHDFFLFSVYDIDKQKYTRPKEAEAMARKLGIKHVHVEGYFRLGDIATDIQGLLERAEGKGLHGKKREGIVLKHVDGGFTFKAISNSYLLKHGE